jgi:phage terminase small subunit
MKKTKQVFPAPPEHLSDRARALWRSIGPAHARSLGRQLLLLQALECLDQCDDARRAIAADGLTTKTKTTGVSHPHSLLKVQRDSRQQFLRAWSLLDLTWDNEIDGAGDWD